MMRHFKDRRGWKGIFLLLCFLILGASEKVSAYEVAWPRDYNQQSNNITMTFNKEKGCVDIRFLLQQTWAGGGDDGWQGFWDQRGGLYVSINGKEIGRFAFEGSRIYYTKKGDWRVGEITYNLDYKSYHGHVISGPEAGDGEWATYTTIHVPIDKSFLGNDLKLHLKGTWWFREYGPSNVDINCYKSLRVDNLYLNAPVIVPFGDDDKKSTTKKYDHKNFKFAIDPQYKNSEDKESQIRVYEVDDNGEWYNDKIISKDGFVKGPYGNSMDFVHPLSTADFNKAQRYYVRKIWQRGQIRLESQVEIIRPAYVYPSNIDYVYRDEKTRRVSICVKMPQLPQDVIDYGWYEDDMLRFHLTTYKRDEKGESLLDTKKEYFQDVPYDPHKSSIEALIDLHEKIDHNVTVAVSRKKFFDWWPDEVKEDGFVKGNSYVHGVHWKPVNFTVVGSEDSKTATLTWEGSGEVWYEGAKLDIVRYEVNEGVLGEGEVVAQLDWNGFNAGRYVDTPPAFKVYNYGLRISDCGPYEVDEMTNGTPIKPILPGNIINLTASKGYFSDQVKLNWSNDTPVHECEIWRKVYKADDAQYVIIGKIGGGASHAKLFFADKDAAPGVIYDYKVVGLTYPSEGAKALTSEQKTIGFSMPTGVVYGHITYGGGSSQAVKGVNVKLSTEDRQARGYAMQFPSGDAFLQTDKELIRTGSDYSFQVHVQPDATGQSCVLLKHGDMELGLFNGKPYMAIAAEQSIVLDKELKTDRYTQLSAVYGKAENGKYVARLVAYGIGAEKEVKTMESDSPMRLDASVLTMGSSYKGYLDEVRIWDRALTQNETDYNHDKMLNGDEGGLIAYYRFNEPVEGFFYDASHESQTYHENHGQTVGTVVYQQEKLPSEAMLAYCGISDAKGDYRIEGIPYFGEKGTVYTLTPRMESHKFEINPEKGTGSENSATIIIAKSLPLQKVDIIDKSSFKVSGVIYYENTTLPVKDVTFKIDGLAAMNKTEFIKTDSKGMFSLDVPIGVHEVVAEKPHHTFVNGGRLTNSYGDPLDYQEPVSNIRFYDNTRVRLIGKVVGGPIQEAYQIGHSLSKNNLGDDIEMVLEPDPSYGLCSLWTKDNNGETDTLKHFHEEYYNHVVRSKENYTIKVNNLTGEYVADLIPEKYMIKKLSVNGSSLEVTQKIIDLTEVFSVQTSEYKYQTEEGEFTDKVEYNKEYSHIEKGEPSFFLTEMQPRRLGRNKEIRDFEPKDHEGDLYYMMSVVGEEGEQLTDSIPLFVREKGTYTLNKPVYHQNSSYYYLCEAFTLFKYNGLKTVVDTIPVNNARVSITNNFCKEIYTNLDLGTEGRAIFKMVPDNPNVAQGTDAIQDCKFNFSANGFDQTRTVSGYLMGAETSGQDFVTAGPSELLMVLRDPPGSNSYAYSTKGVNVTCNYDDTQNGWYQEGNNSLAAVVGVHVSTLKGTPFLGVVSNGLDTEDVSGAVLDHQEHGQDNKVDSYSYTFNTSYQTSSDPDYVGRDADLLIGSSYNMLVGWHDEITIKPVRFVADPQDVIAIIPGKSRNEKEDLALCRARGLITQKAFNTLFAYPQIHIEEVLIPKSQGLIESLLEEGRGLNKNEALAKAAELKHDIYVPKYEKGHDFYGIPNPEPAPWNEAEQCFKGKYYDIYMSSDRVNAALQGKVNPTDSVLTLHSSIDKWKQILAENEEIKVKAFKEGKNLENISFQAGAVVERSKEWSTSTEDRHTYEFQIGSGVFAEATFKLGSIGTRVNIDERAGKVNGYEKSQTDETENTIGFVLEDSGTDYHSIDVFEVKSEQLDAFTDDQDEDDGIDQNNGYHKTIYTDYVFRLRGGATSAPYEGKQVTKYYNKGQEILSFGTLQIEKPHMKVFGNDIQSNVPSDEAAVFDLGLTNYSETQEDCFFDLRLDDESNPYGAQISIDGVPLGDGRAFKVPVNDFMHKQIEVRRSAGHFNFDNLKLILSSQGQGDPTSWNGDISDSVKISARFVPASTKVRLKTPAAGWILNKKSQLVKIGNDSIPCVPVKVTDFNANDTNLVRIEIQFKPVSESETWSTLRTFYRDPDTKLQNPKEEEIIGTQSELTANFIGYQDEMYDIRAVSYSQIGKNKVTYVSEVARGTKDLESPQLFGQPKPADGILNIEDEIRLDFNEEIAGGQLGINNFEVTAVKNGVVSDRNISVSLDGKQNVIETEHARNWENRDLTFEGWVYINDLNKPQGIFSAGNKGNGMSLSYLKKNGVPTLRFASAKETFNLDAAVPALKAKAWSHVAAVVDNKDSKVYIYLNSETMGQGVIADEKSVNNPCDGLFYIGKNFNEAEGLSGKVDEVRIWDKAMDDKEIQKTMNVRLSGAEPSLIAYYPMDDPRGHVVEDKARGNNAKLEGNWNTPDSYAYAFDGKDDVVAMKPVSVGKNQDFTLDFWFKTDGNVTDSVAIFSNARAENKDAEAEGEFLIGFENQKLVIRSNGRTIVLNGKYDDQNWQHFVLTVNRTAGYGKVFINDRMVNYFNSDSIKAVSGNEIYLGARLTYHPETVRSSADRFFKGYIDEVRIWNNSFSDATLATAGINKLSGKEFGLVAYYPFEEWYTNPMTNISELIPTDKDMVSGQTAALQGTPQTTLQQHAPIAGLSRRTPVAYDYVVNKDALIIRLTEAEELIENTIVDFSVKNVRDIHGNEMAGPVRWSALIQRNPISWGEDHKELSIPVNEGAEFSVRLNNKCGEAKSFVLEGLPSWLEAEPARGKIKANSSIDVLFTVNEGTNIGRYDEMVYARGENKVAAALPVKVKVNGQKPDWKVDEGKYEHSMAIFGQVYFNESLSDDEEDMVGVFCKDSLGHVECVGVSHTSFDKKRDMWYNYITVYRDRIPQDGVELKDSLEFRLWDASTGQYYAGKVNSLKPKNAICGSLLDLVKITGQEMKYRNLELAAGWNWVTFAVLPTEAPSSNELLKNGLWNMNSQVKSKNGFESYSSEHGWVAGADQEISYARNQMYLIHTDEAQTVPVLGIEDRHMSVLAQGQTWNYIGYTPSFNMPVNEAMAGYRATEGDVLKSKTEFAMYTAGDWVGSLRHMEMNKGYMLYRNAADTIDFNYPLIHNAYGDAEENFADTQNAETVVKYANNLTMVATPVYHDLQEGDVIKAYVDGELRGESRIVRFGQHNLHFLTVAGKNQDKPVVFRLERNGEEIAQSAETIPFVTNATEGTVQQAKEISFDQLNSSVEVYPNPFVSQLNITFTAVRDGQAELSVYDLSGRLVFQKTLDVTKGTNRYTWNGLSVNGVPCQEGVHLVNLKVDGKNNVHEVIKH